MPAKYFEYIFRLKDATALNAYAEQAATMTHLQWCAVLRGDDPATLVLALKDQPDEPSVSDSEDDIDISRANVAPPNELQVATSFSAVRPPVVFPGLLAGNKIVQVFLMVKVTAVVLGAMQIVAGMTKAIAGNTSSSTSSIVWTIVLCGWLLGNWAALV